MEIGNVTSMNSMSGMQMITADSTDSKSRSIQNEMTDVQQKLQKLDSKEELSASEKTIEREKLQKERSSLNTELKRYQEELSKSYKREIRIAKLQEDKEPAKAETDEDKIQKNKDGIVASKEEMKQDKERGVNTEVKPAEESKEEDIAEKGTKAIDRDPAADTGISGKKMLAIVSADSSIQQADRQGTIIANTRDGIAILKGEIDQDERRGVDTEKKQADIKKMEKQAQRAIAFQSSILGEADNRMKSAAETNRTGKQVNAENNAYVSALNVLQEDRAAQQNFHISFRN